MKIQVHASSGKDADADKRKEAAMAEHFGSAAVDIDQVGWHTASTLAFFTVIIRNSLPRALPPAVKPILALFVLIALYGSIYIALYGSVSGSGSSMMNAFAFILQKNKCLLLLAQVARCVSFCKREHCLNFTLFSYLFEMHVLCAIGNVRRPMMNYERLTF